MKAALGLLAIAIVLGLFATSAPTATATVESATADCDVLLDGISARELQASNGDGLPPLNLNDNGTIDVVIRTEHRITEYRFFMKYGPFDVPLYNDTVRGGGALNEDSFFLDATEYTSYGTGLYSIHGNITQRDLQGQQHDCAVAFILRVGGNPLATATGAAAAATGIAAFAGLIQGGVGAYMDTKEVLDSIKDIRESYRTIRPKMPNPP